MHYLLTKARLGDESHLPERQLTKSLTPVREIMDPDDLDFDQLLQRDLDDHRVATELVPYLLTPKAVGPSFFPPIVAAVLPFRNKRPSEFQSATETELIEEGGMSWLQYQIGQSVQVRRSADRDGRAHPVNHGQLWWNQSEARLVVLDGQHRAMAILAVERTLTNSWKDGAGGKFSTFYKAQIRKIMENNNLDLKSLEKIEIPVAVCWFPDEVGEGSDAHRAARKLFVDVNKEARQPSESRIILLSDSELLNILTRRLLSALRADTPDAKYLPLAAIEYDNPETGTSQSDRWSAMANINSLKMAVQRLIFGKKEYLTKVDLKFGGRESGTRNDSFMRSQLNIRNILPETIVDGDFKYDKSQIGNEHFPISELDTITGQFQSTWGEAILRILTDVTPYKAHWTALAGILDRWSDLTTPASLAKDAVFGGVGVYWTLKDANRFYEEANRKSRVSRAPIEKKPDVVHAWDALKAKGEEFEVARAEAYLGSSSASDKSKSLFSVFNTHACQLGIFLTLGSVWTLRDIPSDSGEFERLPKFAGALIDSWNRFFATGQGTAKDRRYAFGKAELKRGMPLTRYPINMISSMDTPQAIYFRYFWLEALAAGADEDFFENWSIRPANFREMILTARFAYRSLLIDQQIKALGQVEGTARDHKAKAVKDVDKRLVAALDRWFDVPKFEYDSWVNLLGVVKSKNNLQVDNDDGEVAIEDVDSVEQVDGPPVASDEFF
ncbi:hypothetical protein CH282_14855 [Rhodococcus sp. 06-418-1B]|nr:hypothetical protein CH282_14855 [Rhodococcus sp. 06-418-1B]